MRVQFRPDRPDGKARSKLVSCRLVPEGERVLNAAAKARGLSRAELIRRAISAYVTGGHDADSHT
jgi:hypothetical protein